MRTEIKPRFHNRFDIVVTNVETGEVELKGQAENMVLDRIYTRLVAFSSYFDQIVSSDEMLVENTSTYAGYQFDANMSCLEGIMEILKALDGWQVKELVDGTVVIGSSNYAGFTRNTTYTFYRGKDIFTRSIVRDDQEAYRRVCVHNQDFSLKVYRDVETYTGWNLQANKTLYVNVPEGTSLTDAESYQSLKL